MPLSREQKSPEGPKDSMGQKLWWDVLLHPCSQGPCSQTWSGPPDGAQSLGERERDSSSASQLVRRAPPQGKKCCSVGIPWRSRGADGNELA